MSDGALTEAERLLALPQGAYPFESHYAEIDGGRLHYADEGQGPVVLMVHGNPTWSILYRGLIEGLRGRYRCVAVDLAGFGLSAPPPASRSGPRARRRSSPASSNASICATRPSSRTTGAARSGSARR